MRKQKRFKNGKLTCCGCGQPRHPENDYYHKGDGYCKKCQLEYKRIFRSRKKTTAEELKEATIKREDPQIAIIRETFNKACEAALLGQAYQHLLVSSLSQTDDYLRTEAKDNVYTISQYSHLRV